jgi:hypothetical protein
MEGGAVGGGRGEIGGSEGGKVQGVVGREGDDTRSAHLSPYTERLDATIGGGG